MARRPDFTPKTRAQIAYYMQLKRRFRRPAPTGPAATGGTETVINPEPGRFFRVHTFLTGGTLSVNSEITTAEYLLIGGGGPGGAATFGSGGGGSAGDVIAQQITLAVDTYAISVGEGGVCVSSESATKGGDTTAFDLTARGGGVGGSRDLAPNDGGGGADFRNPTGAAHPTSFTGGDGTVGEENDERAGGGGRGAAGDGEDATLLKGGDGGAAIISDISGASVAYGRGGGGGRRGGAAGDPNGGGPAKAGGGAGLNPGDGGGGAASTASVMLGGPGGDGIAIIR